MSTHGNTCRLCLRDDRPLLKKSHIIPKFLYQGVFDDKHTAFRIAYNNLDKGVLTHDGEYESNILCKECDNIVIGQFEDYAKRVIFRGYSDQTIGLPDGKIIATNLRDIDYRKIKLFFLSLLWRFSISRREYFKLVDLGIHEENIRKMLISGNPGQQLDYPVWVAVFNGDLGKITEKMTMSPITLRDNEGPQVVMQAGRLMLWFYVSTDRNVAIVKENSPHPNGSMRILHPTGDIGRTLLQSLWRKISGVDVFSAAERAANLER